MRWASDVDINIAEELDGNILGAIGMRAVEEYEIDCDSRARWVQEAKAALAMALQRAEAKTTPWPGASNVIVPIITEAADQFAARAYPAIIKDMNVVKGKVVGLDEGTPRIDLNTGQPLVDPQTGQPQWVVAPGEKKKRADRIGGHMSWQLTEEQTEWEAETDAMLHVLPIVGCAFRKSFRDASLGQNVSLFVSALDLVINYSAKSMKRAPRITEEIRLYPYEITELQQSGAFIYHDFGVSTDSNSGGADRDAPHLFLEQYRRWDMDGDGYPEPYIITIHKETQKVVRIIPNFLPEDIVWKEGEEGQTVKRIRASEVYTKYDFLPNKEGGIYGQGFGQLLKPLNDATNTTINMMFDAEHLRIRGGGFVGKGLSLHAGTLTFKMAEWKVVNAPGGAIRDAIVPLQHQGASPVLFQLLGLLMQASRDISSVKDVLTGEVKAQTMSPTVFMALVEQGLKVFTAIWKRIHRSLTSEFDKLYRLNALYLDDKTHFRVGSQWKEISRADYASNNGAEPISDANMVVDVQAMARSQFLQQFLNDPLLDGVEIRKRMLTAANIPGAESLIKPQNNTPSPMELLEMAKVETQRIAARAAALRDTSAAVKNLAEADAKVMEPFMAWAQAQLNFIQGSLDVQGNQAPTIPGMEAPPGNASIPPISAGRPDATGGRPFPALDGPSGIA